MKYRNGAFAIRAILLKVLLSLKLLINDLLWLLVHIKSMLKTTGLEVIYIPTKWWILRIWLSYLLF